MPRPNRKLLKTVVDTRFDCLHQLFEGAFYHWLVLSAHFP